MRLARSGAGLCGAWFVSDQKHAPAADRFAPDKESSADPLLSDAAQQLQAYFSGTLQDFDLPLDLSAGTAFQQAVWQALRGIPHGDTRSYLALAAQLGKPSATRAVGAAVGRNPISLIVPCHRVLGSSGQLTGYAGGLWRKQALLQLEGLSLF
jgi:methylated-DNA-[protein]-cysteine S-methyltransferase